VHGSTTRRDLLAELGVYVNSGEPEWLVSLTAPPKNPTSGDERAPDATAPDETTRNETAPSATPIIVSGFGAPLWTLVLSIAGAALFTVALVVKEIREPPKEDEAKIRERIRGFVEHQLFMLFAPFGGMFVYQALVLADAANKPITGGVAALGSGVTLNLLLAWASRLASEALASNEGDGGGRAKTNTPEA